MSVAGLAATDLSRPALWSEDGVLSLGQLLGQARVLAAHLPESQGIVNLCERRAPFIMVFCAALMRGQTTYLPASRAPSVVADVLHSFPGSIRVDDESVQRALAGRVITAPQPFEVDPELIAALGFTSGTTGIPRRQRKIWRALLNSNAANAAAIRAAIPEALREQTPWIVATVPPQHMYGFETSVLLPLIGAMAVHSGRPLFPADVARALAEVPEPRVLVTTPIHLRALVESQHAFPPISVVVSATAPLGSELARNVERHLRARLLEMFGSTETCVIATRETARESDWAPYAGVSLEAADEHTLVRAPWFDSPVPLPDLLEMQPNGRFVIRGRHADMIEVAGKRASLAELTQRLLRLEGVHDAAVFQLEAPEGGGVRRIAALVVAPGRRVEELSRELASQIDTAFLPRPLALVDALPRNELGKLPRARLLELLRSLGASGTVQAIELDQ